jgi:hypothetical protein
MTDRPILFSAEMVRAILDGKKTQTRRAMKVQPWPEATVEVGPYHPHRIDRNGESQPGPAVFGAIWDHQDIVNGGDAGLRCPYGAPGDTLWVRETWCKGADDGRQVPLRMATLYRADGEHVTLSDGDGFTQTNRDGSEKLPWRPSIHMPRWASRITLRITDIRVERLHDITEDDARAEGCPYPTEWAGRFVDRDETAKTWFKSLWNKINGPGAWEANPWVWVVAFERVKP